MKLAKRILAFFEQASKSRTVILNTLTTIAGVIMFLQGEDFIINNPDLAAALVSVLGVINIILRFFTVEPVKNKK